jgi:hypothetical protein
MHKHIIHPRNLLRNPLLAVQTAPYKSVLTGRIITQSYYRSFYSYTARNNRPIDVMASADYTSFDQMDNVRRLRKDLVDHGSAGWDKAWCAPRLLCYF